MNFQFNRFLLSHTPILILFFLCACVTDRAADSQSSASANTSNSAEILINPDSSISVEDQTVGQIFLILARGAVQKNDWENAVKEYSRVLDAPELPSFYRAIAHMERGDVYQRKGDLTLAHDDYLAADKLLDEAHPGEIATRVKLADRIVLLAKRLNERSLHIEYWKKKQTLLASRPGIFDQTTAKGAAAHLKSGSVFPEKIGDLERSGFASHDDAGLDVSAGYRQPSAGQIGNITFTVYVYPQGGRDLTQVFASTLDVIAKQHPQRIIEKPKTFGPNTTIGRGEGIITTVRPEEGQGSDSFSPTGLALFESNGWFVKIRYTYEEAAQKTVESAINAFLSEFGWPKPVTTS